MKKKYLDKNMKKHLGDIKLNLFQSFIYHIMLSLVLPYDVIGHGLHIFR